MTMASKARNLVALAFVATALVPAAASANPGDLITSFTGPGYYPAGLAWDGTNLWVSNITWGSLPHDAKNSCFFARLDSSGTVTDRLDEPAQFHHGLAWDGHNLWS